MKFVISILLIALLSAVACFFLPWWMIAVIAFGVTALISQSPGKSFLSGFIALFLFWGALSWYLSAANDHILANKMSVIILKDSGSFLLIMLTAIIGALVAGLGGWAGSFIARRSNTSQHAMDLV